MGFFRLLSCTSDLAHKALIDPFATVLVGLQSMDVTPFREGEMKEGTGLREDLFLDVYKPINWILPKIHSCHPGFY